jgi:hypothetical protein
MVFKFTWHAGFASQQVLRTILLLELGCWYNVALPQQERNTAQPGAASL